VEHSEVGYFCLKTASPYDRVFLLQEVLFDLVVHSVGVSEDGNYTAQAEESIKLWSIK